MAPTTYAIKAAGDRRLLHNGLVHHAGRLVVLESTAPATRTLLALGYIGAPTTETVIEGSGAHLTTYTVTPAGARKVNHNLTLLNAGQTLQLDSLEPTTQRLLQLGYIA